MSLTPSEIGERLQAHLQAARNAKGAVLKSADFYGGALQDEKQRAAIRTVCVEAGFGGQFSLMVTCHRYALAVWEK